MAITVESFDHLVITTTDLDACIAFYTQVLGMRHETFGEGRHSLHFGQSKFNIHVAGHEIRPHAKRPTPGSIDICLIVATPLEEVLVELNAKSITVESDIVARTGANGPIRSIYFRDPDQNLIELSRYV